HVDAHLFVDFGCANGELIKFLSSLFPDNLYIGYDISQEMIDLAKENNSEHLNTFFTSKWEEVVNMMKDMDCKSCLILSSVIHEVYSYGDKSSIKIFWDRVFNSGFDYIAMRDMIYEEYYVSECSMRTEDITKIRKNKKYNEHLLKFEEVYGKLSNSNLKQIIHYLFKYSYDENWEREVKENYLPLSDEDLTKILMYNADNYKEIYYETYTLPFLRRKIKEDFDINISYDTHVKFILEKK
ncbi:MAG: class I SAM-dependent methyltransferase, partial [Bacilli bacterium]|nr:class I SAM-dependent methyltransferase [Bacilli bacterium]